MRFAPQVSVYVGGATVVALLQYFNGDHRYLKYSIYDGDRAVGK